MKLQTLDLHMTRHSVADDKVRSFLNFADLPVRIITGKSQQMRSIVVKVVEEYDYACDFESSYNFGSLIIDKKSKR
tara:strand:- start:37 stop:264 length:228 start_codon:yes stop_codon:yes gene_type:complete